MSNTLPIGTWTLTGDAALITRQPANFLCRSLGLKHSIALSGPNEAHPHTFHLITFEAVTANLVATLKRTSPPAWLTPPLKAQFLLLAHFFPQLEEKPGRERYLSVAYPICHQLLLLIGLYDEIKTQFTELQVETLTGDELFEQVLARAKKAWDLDQSIAVYEHLLHPLHPLVEKDQPPLELKAMNLSDEEVEDLLLTHFESEMQMNAIYGTAVHILSSEHPERRRWQGLLIEANPLRLHALAVTLQLADNLNGELDQPWLNFLTYRDRIAPDPDLVWRDPPQSNLHLLSAVYPTTDALNPLAAMEPNDELMALIERLLDNDSQMLPEGYPLEGMGLVIPPTILPATCQHYEQVRCLLTATGIWCSALARSAGLRYELMFLSCAGEDTIELCLYGAEAWIFRAVLAGLWHSALHDTVYVADLLAPELRLRHAKTGKAVEMPPVFAVDWRTRIITATLISAMLYQN